MDIGRESPLLDRQPGDAPQLDVLADLRHELEKAVGHRAIGAGVDLRLEGLEIGPRVERHRRDSADRFLEGVAARDEVGLGVDLDDGRLALRDGDPDQTVAGGASGLLAGDGDTLLAQPVDRGLDGAPGRDEGPLAVHHAGAGLGAQILYHRRGDLRHYSLNT